MSRVLVAWLLLFFSATLSAQGVVQQGDVEIFYNAIPSGFLTADIAQNHGVLRSRTRGLLLVSVKRGEQTIEARIEAQAGASGEAMQDLTMRPVHTNGMISYLGNFAIAEGESRYFQLRITPAGGQPVELEFSQQFFDQ